MISTFTAVIDANVFYGARLRSLVLFLAQTKIFRARWTDDISAEWIGNLREKRAIADEKLALLRTLVDRTVLDCRVTGYEPLIGSFKLPDVNNEHVLAAAVKTRADVIVTFNLKDFPADILTPLGIEAKHPDIFLLDLFGISTDAFIAAVEADFRHYRTPAITFSDYAASLSKAGIPGTAARIAELRVLIETGDN